MEDLDRPISVNDLRDLMGELRMMARRMLSSESKPHSFTPTALAMTALRRAKLRDQDWDEVRWENRSHFFAVLTNAMRNALIDHARHRQAKGRSNLVYSALDEEVFRDLPGEADESPEQIILLEEALAILESTDKYLAGIIYQFYFMGFSAGEIAEVDQVNEKTVDRNLKKARTLLRKILSGLAQR